MDILYMNDYKVNSIMISYISKPTAILYTEQTKNVALTSLPDHLWSEVIVLAARLALENISDKISNLIGELKSRYTDTYNKKKEITLAKQTDNCQIAFFYEID